MLTNLSRVFQRFTNPFKYRLSRRIVLWVFLSIVVVEGIILIPSVKRREQELLSQLKTFSSGKAAWILITYPEASGEELITHFQKLEQRNPEILGGAVYHSDGRLVGAFGESPQLFPSQGNNFEQNYLPSHQENRYDDIVWSGNQMQTNFTIIIRHDASQVRVELIAYIGRIIGLVAIISAFLTVTVWIALEPIVIMPIIQLRRDLLLAGEAVYHNEELPKFHSAYVKHQDELGEVIAAFEQMFGQICEAISDRQQAEVALKNSLEKVEAYSQALDHELEKGRQIQQNFLPRQLLQKPGWEISVFFQPARQMSGDFYDVFELPEETIGLVIADICDKGVGAALFMGLFRSLIRIFSRQTYLKGLTDQNIPLFSKSLEELLPNSSQGKPMRNPRSIKALEAIGLINDYIAKNHGDLVMFATLFFGVLDPVTGCLTYINGGHEDLFIVNASGQIKESLKVTGPAVGMLPNQQFKIQQTYLEPGDFLLGYTDGVTEARNGDGHFFTKERLISILEKKFSSTNDLLEQISQSLLKYIDMTEQFDDITMLAVQRIP